LPVIVVRVGVLIKWTDKCIPGIVFSLEINFISTF